MVVDLNFVRVFPATDSIRKAITWLNPMSPITISVIKPDEIVIKPHTQHVDWDTIWANINKARSIKGKGTQSITEFLEQDRQSH